MAFGIGAFWEIAWKYVKKKTKKNFEDEEEKPKDSEIAEDRPNNGPR